jgi:hypothetical protein
MAIQPQLQPGVLEFVTIEYREAGEFYRHTHSTIWQSGSILIASAFLVVAFLIRDEKIRTAMTLVPVAMLAFWWLGIFEPMNRYADWRIHRAKQIEEWVSGLAQFMRSGYAPKLASVFRERNSCDCVWRAWRLRVRWAVRGGIVTLIGLLVFVSGIFGLLDGLLSIAGTILGFILLVASALLLTPEWNCDRSER